MGMAGPSIGKWRELRRGSVKTSLDAGVPATCLSAASRSLRLMLQVGIPGAAAFPGGADRCCRPSRRISSAAK